ncbi:MAG TPA: nucleotidyltransferase family protein [Thermoplasmata archaeon]|nr:nucleotidyltransferase family protein [Thermoplasmata archaeon]
MTVAALILAAGESSRFEGYPKALLTAGRRSAVRRLAEIAIAQQFDPIAVVVGAHKGPITHELRDLPVEIVDAEQWYEGRTASIQAGISALPDDRDILLWPIDHPFVSPRTVETLTALLSTDMIAVWYIPTYEGNGGHPVLWRSVIRPDVLDLRPDAPVRSLLPEFGPQVRRVPVEDPGVVANVDTPDAYRDAYETWLARGEE